MEFVYNNVIIDPVTQCWNWNKSITSAGYGQFTRNKKYWTTHTLIFNVYAYRAGCVKANCKPRI